MADDTMKNDDAQRNMGANEDKKDVGQQAPGRNPQDDRSTGAGQQGQHIPEKEDKAGASEPTGQKA